MPFDDSTISDISIARKNRHLVVSWSSSAPSGTHHQLYAGGRLVWSGVGTTCTIPAMVGVRTRFVVGTVGAEETFADFSASLPAAPWKDRVTLDWWGGTYLGDDIAGFNIYRGASPGAAVDYSARVGSVTAYPQGIIMDGAGIGCAGYGVAGRAASNYSWRSGPLAAGTWNFGIRPANASGVEGPSTEMTRVVASAPSPPPAIADGIRMMLEGYDSTTRVATLTWLPPA